jgi:hypothetical protein
MAYDSARQRVVLFGGYNNNVGRFGDTWEWDGETWTQVSTTGPSARYWHAMAYDSARQRVVLFGGGSNGSLRDTWEWDGATWIQVPTTGPSARYSHAMAYDSARGRVVLFGGYGRRDDGNYARFGDTWEWDGDNWIQVSTSGPSARYSHAMAYDSARGRTFLFGGARSAYDLLYDTWEYIGPAVSATPTPIPTPIPTISPSPTPSPSPTISPTPSPSPYYGRPFGDFDSSGCTNLSDLFFIFDYWQQDIDGIRLSLEDFIMLLDNWQQGPQC